MLSPAFRGVVLAVACGAIATMARAGDPGDLFPNVTYDQAVGRPSRATGSPATHVNPVTPVNPTPVTPVPPPVVTPVEPAPPSASTQRTPSKTKPPAHSGSTKTAHAIDSVAAFWSPYSGHLLVPMLSNEEMMEYSQSYGAILADAYNSDDTRVAAAVLLAAAAAPEKSIEQPMRRYLLMESLSLAVDGRAPVAMRETLAGQFLPLVERDHTLPATQAKATALAALAMSGTAAAPASPKLLDLAAQAYGDLALSQIQAGYPSQAHETLYEGQSWLVQIPPPNGIRQMQFAAVEYYLVRAQAAKQLAPKLKQTLTATPDDVTANTQVATLQLSLFADLSKAAACAAKSDKPEFKALAKFVSSLDGGTEAVDPATAQGMGHSVELCRALLTAAPACADSFDRWAIAMYVRNQTDELVTKYKADMTARSALQTMQTQAIAIMTANPPPAFTPVPAPVITRHTIRTLP